MKMLFQKYKIVSIDKSVIIVTDEDKDVHVSGHPSRDELD